MTSHSKQISRGAMRSIHHTNKDPLLWLSNVGDNNLSGVLLGSPDQLDH